jgi:hypothetical protein
MRSPAVFTADRFKVARGDTEPLELQRARLGACRRLDPSAAAGLRLMLSSAWGRPARA